MATKQCVKCGLLALRHMNSGQLEETPLKWREHWEKLVPGDVPDVRTKEFHKVPVCFVLAYSLAAEVGTSTPYDDRIAKAVTKDRDCDKFTKWMQGYTPREHREMILTEKMLRRQRKWAKEDSAHREEQRREDITYRDNQRKADQDRDEQRTKRETFRFRVTLALGLIIVPLAAAILPTLLPGCFRGSQQPAPSAPETPTTAKADAP